MYFKINDGKYNGFQYVSGLNILKEEFNVNCHNPCCANGFYFADIANIFKFINYGYLTEVTLPCSALSGSSSATLLPCSALSGSSSDNPDFKMIKDPKEDKYRANMIILGKRYDLSKVETLKYLIENGADIHADNDAIFRYNAENGNLDIVKYLVENGANVHAENNAAFSWSAYYSHWDVYQFLKSKC